VARIEVTRLAREDLDGLIEALRLPADTGERVSRSLSTLEVFPRAGKRLDGFWRDHRAVVGPWGWLTIVYAHVERDDAVIVIAFLDSRSAGAPTGR